MACCLTAPSNYLIQCWLIISKAQRHSSEGNFTIDTPAINHWHYLENCLSTISLNSPRANELTKPANSFDWVCGYQSGFCMLRIVTKKTSTVCSGLLCMVINKKIKKSLKSYLPILMNTLWCSGYISIQRYWRINIGIPVMNIRRPDEHIIFIMWITILKMTVFILTWGSGLLHRYTPGGVAV